MPTGYLPLLQKHGKIKNGLQLFYTLQQGELRNIMQSSG